MIRFSPIVVAFSILSSAVRAEPVHDMTERLEICFQEARAADVACIDPANDTVKRVACFQSTRAAQVECLENISHEPPTGSAQNQPSDTAWVVSETTSPVDYAPLITAVIHSTSSEGCTKHSGCSLSWTTHRTPAPHDGNVARDARKRSSGRLSDQRPTLR